MTPGADLVGVEQEPGARIRPAKNHQQRRAVTKRVNRGLVLGRQGRVGIGLGVGIRQRLNWYSDAGQAHGRWVVPSPLLPLELVVRHDVRACFLCRGG